jgi:mannitol/fructose-specific phosphotransferase system IIA component (Ntr-type)
MNFKDFITEENVALNENFNDWRDAIRFAGSLLVRSGSVNQNYVDNMVKLVETMGPYIVIMPGVALAHARPNGDVSSNQIALVTIPKGVAFGNPDNDPVYFLFAIAARTDNEHLMMFKVVAEFLSKEKNLETLRKATCFRDIKF